MNNTFIRIAKVIAEGTFWSLIGIIIAFWLLPLDCFSNHMIINGFARRWDGGCTGWTRGLALEHIIADLITWWCYITITVVLYRLHPILEKVKYSFVTVAMMGVFITFCGLTHLVEAYTTLNPIYRLSAKIKLISAATGIIALFFIAYGLITTFAIVAEKRKKAAKLEKMLCGRS